MSAVPRQSPVASLTAQARRGHGLCGAGLGGAAVPRLAGRAGRTVPVQDRPLAVRAGSPYDQSTQVGAGF